MAICRIIRYMGFMYHKGDYTAVSIQKALNILFKIMSNQDSYFRCFDFF